MYVISEKFSESGESRGGLDDACCKLELPEAALSGVDYSMYGSHKVRFPTHLQELCPRKVKENSEELELELELAPVRCESGLVPPKVSIKSFCLVKEVWERTDK